MRTRLPHAAVFLVLVASTVAFALGAWRPGAGLAVIGMAVGAVSILEAHLRNRRRSEALLRHQLRLLKRLASEDKVRHHDVREIGKAVERLATRTTNVSGPLGVLNNTSGRLETLVDRVGRKVFASHADIEGILQRLDDTQPQRTQVGHGVMRRRPHDVSFRDIWFDDKGQHLSASYQLKAPTPWGLEMDSGQVRFSFDIPVQADENTVALSLAAFIGPGMKSAFIDMDVDEATAEAIGAWAPKCEVTFRSLRAGGSPRVVDPVPERALLSFSAGMDSLAALQLLPDNTLLYGIDFGGGFSREKAFFSSWDMPTVSTNLIETPLRSTGWQFMAVPAILAAHHFRADTLTFGSVDEKGNIFFIPGTDGAPKQLPIIKAAGMRLASCLVGLTEVAVTKIVLEAVPELASASLVSCAGPREDKGYWKRMLAIVASSRWDIPFEPPHRPTREQPHFAYGQYFPLDMLSFWVAKHGGRQAVDELVRDVPEDVFTTADRLNLTFFERANPNMYGSHYPDHLRDIVVSKFSQFGIDFYDEKDREEIAEVREILARYHPMVR